MTPVLQYLQSEIYACIFYFLSIYKKLSCLNLFQKKNLYKKMLEGQKSPNVISHKSRNNNDV